MWSGTDCSNNNQAVSPTVVVTGCNWLRTALETVSPTDVLTANAKFDMLSAAANAQQQCPTLYP